MFHAGSGEAVCVTLVRSWWAWRDTGGSAKGEVSIEVTDRLLMNINIKSDGTYLIAPRLGEQSHGQTGVRVFLRSRKTRVLELMKEGSFGFWWVIGYAL